MAKKKSDVVEVRVLADVEINGVKLVCGTVARVGADSIAAYSDSFDASPEAVEYAKSVGADIVDATSEESPE